MSDELLRHLDTIAVNDYIDPRTRDACREAAARIRALTDEVQSLKDSIHILGAESDDREALAQAIDRIQSDLAAARADAPLDDSRGGWGPTHNPLGQVAFRAGLLACREYMARFVEAQSPDIAMSIRANWWPSLGADPGTPRQLDFNEIVTGGEDGPWSMRDDFTASLEALPYAMQFLLPPIDAALSPTVSEGAGEGEGR